MKKSISVKQAAGEIGCSVEYLRRQMKVGKWKLGAVVKPDRNCKKYRFFVFRPQLDRLIEGLASGQVEL